MTLSPKKRSRGLYLGLAFILPVFGYLAICLARWAEPFGNESAFLLSDSYYQYYPFFKAFRRALLSGDSLLYSWDVGMGMDYLGLISYYLASPLNLLVVLVPESWTLELYFILVPIRLGLASAFFAHFLERTFHKCDLSISLFGCFYGTCAWALGYVWNVMWLDTFALLPLVALGTIALLRDRKFVLYTLTLFLSIFANYYIGFFTCIFVLLLFIGYQICCFTTLRRFFCDLGRIALFSVLAIGMTAILELPALASLSTTVSMVPNGSGATEESILDKIPKDFRLNIVDSKLYSEANGAYLALRNALKAKEYTQAWESFRIMNKSVWTGLLNGMRQVAGNMGGGLTHTVTTGLPNLYCGVGTIFLAALFLTARDIKLRYKLTGLGMLLFLTLSFLLRRWDYMWHGFHFPNQIPYRFSFIFSFLLLCMAYWAWTQRHKFKPWQFAIAAMITLGLFACSNSRSDLLFIVYNLAFFLMYLGCFCFGLVCPQPPEEKDRESRKKYLLSGIRQRQLSTLALCVIMCVELVMNLGNFGTKYTDYGITSYPKGGQDAYDIVSIMKEVENRELFYRAETTHAQLHNDGAMLNYNGISTFSSSADVDTTKFLEALGLGGDGPWNRYDYEETSPVTNLFLNLKYMIERTRNYYPTNAYFDEVYTVGSVTLLKNNAYLPLGFLAQAQLANTDISPNSDMFALQNQLMMDASGISGNVWQKQYGNLEIDHHNLVVTNQKSSGSCSFKDGQSAYRCTDCGNIMPYSHKCDTCGQYGTQEGACANCEGGRILPATHFSCSYCGGMVDSSVYITFTYTASQDGLFCVELPEWAVTEVSGYTAYHNDSVIISNENIDGLGQIHSICNVSQGDILELRFHVKQNASGSIRICAAILDDGLFRQAYNELNTSTLKLTSFSNTRIDGVIDCHRSGLLYTSIPDNGSWVATVDGEEVPIVVVGNAMVAVSLTEGTHTISFRYENKAFQIGWKISLLCLAVFVTLWYVYYKRPSAKGKYEK